MKVTAAVVDQQKPAVRIQTTEFQASLYSYALGDVTVQLDPGATPESAEGILRQDSLLPLQLSHTIALPLRITVERLPSTAGVTGKAAAKSAVYRTNGSLLLVNEKPLSTFPPSSTAQQKVGYYQPENVAISPADTSALPLPTSRDDDDDLGHIGGCCAK